MTELVVDLRRAFDSGLGTYIREVIPRTLTTLAASLPEPLRVTGLVAHGSESRHRSYLGASAIKLQVLPAAPLTVAEQWALRRALPATSLLWATTLAHPLFTARRLVATVHDVLQVALPAPAGPGPLVRGVSRLYFRSLRRSAELLLFNSAFSLDEFRRHVGAPNGRCVVTPLGVDRQRWSPGNEAPPLPCFVALGNLSPHKNLAQLVRAFECVCGELPHELVLIGRQPGRLPFEIPAALAPRIRLLGELDQAHLQAYLRQATALVLPSLYEGFGLPALEAMACGCPVLASSAGALPLICGDAALFFDPNDVDSLARALLRAARMTPAKRAQWRAAGLRRASTMPWQRTADQTADALRGALLDAGVAARAATVARGTRL